MPCLQTKPEPAVHRFRLHWIVLCFAFPFCDGTMSDALRADDSCMKTRFSPLRNGPSRGSGTENRQVSVCCICILQPQQQRRVDHDKHAAAVVPQRAGDGMQALRKSWDMF